MRVCFNSKKLFSLIDILSIIFNFLYENKKLFSFTKQKKLENRKYPLQLNRFSTSCLKWLKIIFHFILKMNFLKQYMDLSEKSFCFIQNSCFGCICIIMKLLKFIKNFIKINSFCLAQNICLYKNFTLISTYYVPCIIKIYNIFQYLLNKQMN